jgi:hypothetical protein
MSCGITGRAKRPTFRIHTRFTVDALKVIGLPLGITSPLGIGPAGPVGPTRIPLGATELATPGASPILSGASPLDPFTGVACGGALSAAATSAAVTSELRIGVDDSDLAELRPARLYPS